jgi:hypothetical protein
MEPFDPEFALLSLSGIPPVPLAKPQLRATRVYPDLPILLENIVDDFFGDRLLRREIGPTTIDFSAKSYIA